MPRCASPKSCTRPTTTARRLHRRHRALLPQHSAYHAPVRQLEELHAHGDCCAAAAPPPPRLAAPAATFHAVARQPEDELHAPDDPCAAAASPPPRLAASAVTYHAAARQLEELHARGDCCAAAAPPPPRLAASAQRPSRRGTPARRAAHVRRLLRGGDTAATTPRGLSRVIPPR